MGYYCFVDCIRDDPQDPPRRLTTDYTVTLRDGLPFAWHVLFATSACQVIEDRRLKEFKYLLPLSAARAHLQCLIDSLRSLLFLTEDYNSEEYQQILRCAPVGSDAWRALRRLFTVCEIRDVIRVLEWLSCDFGCRNMVEMSAGQVVFYDDEHAPERAKGFHEKRKVAGRILKAVGDRRIDLLAAESWLTSGYADSSNVALWMRTQTTCRGDVSTMYDYLLTEDEQYDDRIDW